MQNETLLEKTRVTIRDREAGLRERLTERLQRTARLRCEVHGTAVEAVAIHSRENGWYDTMWTTCCEKLEKQASAILKQRC